MKVAQAIAGIALGLSMVPVAVYAGDAGTLYTQVGTGGLGIGYAASINDSWAARGQINSYKRSFSGDVGDFGVTANLTADFNLSTVELLGDWYPGDGGFRFTGGIAFNNNKITVNGTGAKVGSAINVPVNGEIKMSDGMSPYLGLGYSTKPKAAKGLGFNFDLGVLFQNPKVSLTAPGATQADIDAQIAKVDDAIKPLKTMPIIGLGISYSF